MDVKKKKGNFSSSICKLFSRRTNFRLVQIESICRKQINVTKMLGFVLERIGNIVGKGENAGNQHFLLFPQCFQILFFPRVVKAQD